MPAFQTWGPVIQSLSLPPTPPEYRTAYATPTSAISDQSYHLSHGYSIRTGQTGRDFIDRYAHAPPYAAQQAVTIQHQSRLPYWQTSQDYRKAPPFVPLPTQYHCDPSAAPILPPIRVQESYGPAIGHYVHGQADPKPREEKSTGGVAAHLDYDVELMANFVAEMSQRMYA